MKKWKYYNFTEFKKSLCFILLFLFFLNSNVYGAGENEKPGVDESKTETLSKEDIDIINNMELLEMIDLLQSVDINNSERDDLNDNRLMEDDEEDDV